MPGLDEKLDGGWQRGEYSVLGAASGHGKTTLAMQFARTAALQFAEEKVVLVSPEMREDAIAEMEWCAQASVTRFHLKKHPHDIERMPAYVEENVPGNVLCVQMPRGAHIDELADTVREIQYGNHVSLVIVDYAQFVLGRIDTGGRQRFAIAQQIVEACEEISRSASPDLGEEGPGRLPAVLLTSQINVTKEKSKVVDMTIRESALFEHGAAAVVFFVREFDDQNQQTDAYFRITKARFGTLGKVSVASTPGVYGVAEKQERF